MKRFDREHWHKLTPIMQQVAQRFLVKKISSGDADDLPELVAPSLINDDGAAFELYARKIAASRIDPGKARSLLEGLKMRNCEALKQQIKKAGRL